MIMLAITPRILTKQMMLRIIIRIKSTVLLPFRRCLAIDVPINEPTNVIPNKKRDYFHYTCPRTRTCTTEARPTKKIMNPEIAAVTCGRMPTDSMQKMIIYPEPMPISPWQNPAIKLPTINFTQTPVSFNLTSYSYPNFSYSFIPRLIHLYAANILIKITMINIPFMSQYSVEHVVNFKNTFPLQKTPNAVKKINPTKIIRISFA